MISSLSTRLPKRGERGFTLIELLVVIIIIGILAAVAIPLFLDQRKLAADAAVKSDVRNTATQVQQWVAQNPNTVATDATAYTTAGGKVVASTGDTVGVSVATDGSYTVCGYTTNATGKAYNAASASYVFDSTTGRFGNGSCTGGIVGGGSPSGSASPSATTSPSATATPTPTPTPTPVAPTITTASLPNGKVGSSYDQTLSASGGTGSTSWALTSGTLPSGLQFDQSLGRIYGTPVSGSYGTVNLTFTATASNLTSSPKNLSLRVTEDIALANASADSSSGGGWGTYWANPSGFSTTVSHTGPGSYYGQVSDGNGGGVQGAYYCYNGGYKTNVRVSISVWAAGTSGSSWIIYSRANNWEGWDPHTLNATGTAASSFQQFTSTYTPDGNTGPLCIGGKQAYSASVSGQQVYLDDVTLTLG